MAENKEFDIQLYFTVTRKDTGEPYTEVNQSWSAVPYRGLIAIQERLVRFEQELLELGRAPSEGFFDE